MFHDFMVILGPKCSEKFAEHQDRTSNTSELLILAQNRTSNLPNIIKNRTVHEHRTVRSKTNSNSTGLAFLWEMTPVLGTEALPIYSTDEFKLPGAPWMKEL